MNKPTAKQQQVLDYIAHHREFCGFSPILKEMAEYFEVNVNSIQCHVKALKKKGLIEWERNSARTIVLK